MARPLHPNLGDGPETAGFVQRGKVLIVRRQFQDAVKVCRIGLLASPTNVEGRLVLGLALMALGRHDEVLAEMRVGLEVDPDNPMAHLLKGEALFHLRRFDRSLEVLAEAQRLDPHNEKVHKLRAEVERSLAELSGDLLPIVPTITKVYPARGAHSEEQTEQSDAVDLSELHHSVVQASYEPTLDADTAPDEVDDPAIDVSIDEAADIKLSARDSDLMQTSDDDTEFSTALWLPPTQRPPAQSGGWEGLSEEAEEETDVGNTDGDARRVSKEDESDPTEIDPLDGVIGKQHSHGLQIQDTELPTTGPRLPVDLPPALDPLPSFGDPRTKPYDPQHPDDDVGNIAVVEGDDEDDGYQTVINVDAPPPEALFGDDDEQSADPNRRSWQSAAGEQSFDAQAVLDTSRVHEQQDPHDEEPSEDLSSADQAGWRRRLAEEATAAVAIDVANAAIAESHARRVGADDDDHSMIASVASVDPRSEAEEGQLRQARPRDSDLTEPPSEHAIRSDEEMTVDAPRLSVETPEDDEESLPALRDEDSQPSWRIEPTAAISSQEQQAVPSDEAELPEISQLSVLAELPTTSAPTSGPIFREISVEVMPDAMPPLPPDEEDSAAEDAPPSDDYRDGAVDGGEESGDLATRIKFPKTGDRALGWEASAAQARDVEDSAAGYHDGAGDDYDDRLADDNLGPDPYGQDAPDAWPLTPPGDLAPIEVPNKPDVDELAVEPADNYGEEYPEQPYYPQEPYQQEPYQQEPYQQEPYQQEPYQQEPYQQEPYQQEPYQQELHDQDYQPEYGDPAANYPDDDYPDQRHNAEPYDEPFEPFEESKESQARHPDSPPGAALAARFGQSLGNDDPHFEDIISRGDGLLEQMTGSPQMPRAALRVSAESPRRVEPALIDRRRSMRRPPSRSTTFLTILLGEPGSRRWIVLLAGSVGVLILAVGVGLLVRHLRVSDEIEVQRREALQRLKRGNFQDFDHARQIFTNILRRRSDHAQARSSLLHVNAAIPFEFGTPIPPQERAIPADGSVAQEEGAVAATYNALIDGDLRQAADLLFKYRNVMPQSALLLYLDGRVQLLLGKPVAAITYLKRAHALQETDVNTLRWMAEAYAAHGAPNKALAVFRQAAALNKDHLGTILGRAHLLIAQRRDLDSVERSLREMLRAKRLASRGQRGWAYLLLARIASLKGQVKAANTFIRQARSSEPVADPTFFDELAGVLIAAFKPGEAERAATRSDKLMPGRPHPKYRMAQIYLRQGRPRAALQALQRSTQLRQSSLLKARIHLQLGETKHARTQVQRTLKRSPNQLDALVLKAEIIAADGSTADAESLLRPLLSQHPNNAMLTTAIGKILLKKRQPAEARAKFKLALKQDPNALEARLLLADAFLAEGNYPSAHSVLVAASRDNAWHITARRKLAELDYDRWDLRQARIDLTDVLKKAPGDRAARLDLVRVLIGLREYSAADEQLRQLQGADAALALVKGQLALGRGNVEKATSHLETATRRNPRDPTAWSLLVQAHLFNKVSVSTAGRVARKMNDRCPGEPESYAALGRVALNGNQLASAQRYFARAVSALERHPRPPRVAAELHVLLGQLHSDDGRLDAALAQYDRALHVCPKCPRPLHRKGLALDEKARGTEAIALLQRALAIDPKDPELNLDLAKVYEKNGRVSSAIAMYKKYLTFNIPPEFARDAREAMNALRRR